MSVEICGYSDDLIEIYGDLREERDAIDSHVPRIITLTAANGHSVSLNMVYAPDGVWRIGVRDNPDGAAVTIDKAPDDSEDCYSDNAVVAGTWISAVVKPAPTRGANHNG